MLTKSVGCARDISPGTSTLMPMMRQHCGDRQTRQPLLRGPRQTHSSTCTGTATAVKQKYRASRIAARSGDPKLRSRVLRGGGIVVDDVERRPIAQTAGRSTPGAAADRRGRSA